MASELQGRYRLISNLGHGNFATVYLAKDNRANGALVAVKAICTEGFSQVEFKDLNVQFELEAKILMSLSHPGLPKVMAYFNQGMYFYIVMEWIAGKTMHQEVLESDGITQDTVLEWGIKLSDVLSYLHSRKPYPILLGDLKPSNVMLTYNGDLKVIDFGVARYFAPSKSPRTFTMVSPGFAPPEKYNRFDCDLRGDIYSLGATLYWCLTQANMAKFNFNVPPLRKLKPNANHWLEAVLAKCMEYAPERRYSSVAQVRDELVSVRKELQGREERATEKSSNILEQLYRQKYGDSHS